MRDLLTEARLSLLARKYEPLPRSETVQCLACLKHYHESQQHACTPPATGEQHE